MVTAQRGKLSTTGTQTTMNVRTVAVDNKPRRLVLSFECFGRWCGCTGKEIKQHCGSTSTESPKVPQERISMRALLQPLPLCYEFVNQEVV